MADVHALQETLKLILDAVKDTAAAVASGKASWTNALVYQNLIGDLFTVVPDLGLLPAQLKSLSLADAQLLLAGVIADMGAFAPDAKVILSLSLVVLKDLSPSFVTDLIALISKVSSLFQTPVPPAPIPAPPKTATLVEGNPSALQPDPYVSIDGYRLVKELPKDKITTGYLIETGGLCLGLTKGWGYHWVGFTAPEALVFTDRGVAEDFAAKLYPIHATGYTVTEHQYSSLAAAAGANVI